MTETPVRLVDVLPRDSRWEEMVEAVRDEVAPRRGRGFADRMARRLMSYSETQAAVGARQRTRWSGLILLLRVGQYGEVSFPWTHPDSPPDLPMQLVEQARARLITDGARHIIAERTIVAGETDWPAFEERQFRTYWRSLMARSLATWSAAVSLPVGYRLGEWDPDWLSEIGTVIYEANRGTVDAVLYPRFFGGSERQCTDALRDIIAGALGRIDRHATGVLMTGSRACGVCLVGLVGDQHGIIELAVGQAHQRKGLGRALMTHALNRLVDAGADRVALAVSADNTHAVRLYDRLGFAETTRFPVCVWQPPT